MDVLKIENETNVLQKYMFNAGDTDDEATFKAKVKMWLTANTSLTWETFYDRVISIDSRKIVINML